MGQSRLARRLTPILPAMSLADALETTRVHRVAARTALVTRRPCHAPHHTIAAVGLIGGGQVPLPGEVSLAHQGVRCVDVWLEFRRHALGCSASRWRRVSYTYNLAGILDVRRFTDVAL